MPIILLFNAGSSSLKFTLLDAGSASVLAQGQADWSVAPTHYRYTSRDGVEQREEVSWQGPADAVRRALHDLTKTAPIALPDPAALTAVGHRVVHGGDFTEAIRITPEVRSRLAALAELAPLHNPPSLEALAAAEAALPDVPHVAVFDTTFHRTLPPEACAWSSATWGTAAPPARCATAAAWTPRWASLPSKV